MRGLFLDDTPRFLMITDSGTAAGRWVASAAQGQQRFTDGVQNTTKDPTALAIAQQQSLLSSSHRTRSSRGLRCHKRQRIGAQLHRI